MKRCPDCNRTFENTFTFCLADGSLLSPPIDDDSTQSFGGVRDSELEPTRKLPASSEQAKTFRSPSSEGDPASLPETVASLNPGITDNQKTFLPPTQENDPADEVVHTPEMRTIRAFSPDLVHPVNNDVPNALSSSATTPGDPARSSMARNIALAAAAMIVVAGIAATAWFALRNRGPANTNTQSAATQRPASPSTPTTQAASGKSFTENANGTKIEMISVPAGSFVMGSPLTEAGRDNDEGPQSNVSIQNFFLGKDEVTQAQYKAVMGTNPSSFKGDDLPVDSISWNDAEEFCRKLSKLTGHSFRLPTEAEWEYAARAGSTGPYSANLESIAWDSANSGNKTHPAGQKEANKYGLYDIYGNVWEWCQSKYKPYPYSAGDGREDVATNDVRVMRGGSFESAAVNCRSAYRRRVVPALNTVGFRVAMSAS